MNYTEKNLVIAEWLGLKHDYGFFDGISLVSFGMPFAYGATGSGTSELKFHQSLEWLIPVLREIGNRLGDELVIHAETCYWNNFGDNELATEFLGYNYHVSDGIYLAILERIEYYNKFGK